MRRQRIVVHLIIVNTTACNVNVGSRDTEENSRITPHPASSTVYIQNQPAPIDDRNQLPDYIRQCEAVLGKIPEVSCDPANPAPGTSVTRVPVLTGGRLLGFGGTTDKKILAIRKKSGKYRCDFPSIGGDFPCTIGSTLVHYQDKNNPNVQWVGLCRGVPKDIPNYDRFIGNGLIGANEITGEMCFFFGKNDQPEAPYKLPPLRSDVDNAEQLRPWLPPTEMPGSCLSCHPNNDPWILTPWLQPKYMRTVLLSRDYPLKLPKKIKLKDIMAARHIVPTAPKYKSLLPEPLPAGRSAWTEEEIFSKSGRLIRRQYRAIGSSYVRNEARGKVKPRTGRQPDTWTTNFRERLKLLPNNKSCAAGCHALANEHVKDLALDALGRKFAHNYLSPAMASGRLPGASWMPISTSRSALQNKAEQRRFLNAQPTIPAITECPIPKRLDKKPDVQVICSRGDPDIDGPYVDIQWEYINTYGGVPRRNDVRFDVALGFDSASELASTVQELGKMPNNSPEGAFMEPPSAQYAVLRDVASSKDRGSRYQMKVPFFGKKPSLRIYIQPKRYCFEEPHRRPFAYAQPYVLDVTPRCE
ncbi:MAG: hypothetical protein KTR25_12945 [Myxococcales bacterium]|nr:hypothetical protein [Myxococcales bacterium]